MPNLCVATWFGLSTCRINCDAAEKKRHDVSNIRVGWEAHALWTHTDACTIAQLKTRNTGAIRANEQPFMYAKDNIPRVKAKRKRIFDEIRKGYITEDGKNHRTIECSVIYNKQKMTHALRCLSKIVKNASTAYKRYDFLTRGASKRLRDLYKL